MIRQIVICQNCKKHTPGMIGDNSIGLCVPMKILVDSQAFKVCPQYVSADPKHDTRGFWGEVLAKINVLIGGG